MRNVIAAFEEAEATSSRYGKVVALRELEGESRLRAVSLMDALMNPFKTYGVSAPTDVEFQGSIGDPNAECDLFLDLLGRLERRELTGHAAISAVTDFLRSCHSESGRWFQRIINGDGPVGVGWATVRDGLAYEVPYFSCQCAEVWNGTLDPTKSYIVEPKLDGMRCLLVLDPAGPRAVSRSGKPVKNMEEILDACAKVATDLVIDGELFADDWQSSITAGRAEGSDVEKELWAFDAVPWDDFKKRSSQVPLRDRLSLLGQFAGVEGITIVPHRTVNTPEQVTEAAREYVREGFEGGVLKDLDAPYLFDRGDAWQKVKFFLDSEFLCSGVYEGNGRLKGMLGGIVVNVGRVQVGVGTGFSDAQRDSFWKDPGRIVGKLVTVKYQRKSPDGALLFPVFLRVRDEVM